LLERARWVKSTQYLFRASKDISLDLEATGPFIERWDSIDSFTLEVSTFCFWRVDWRKVEVERRELRRASVDTKLKGRRE